MKYYSRELLLMPSHIIHFRASSRVGCTSTAGGKSQKASSQSKSIDRPMRATAAGLKTQLSFNSARVGVQNEGTVVRVSVCVCIYTLYGREYTGQSQEKVSAKAGAAAPTHVNAISIHAESEFRAKRTS